MKNKNTHDKLIQSFPLHTIFINVKNYNFDFIKLIVSNRILKVLLVFNIVVFALFHVCTQPLADYMSMPFPTLLKASPDGDKIAWVFNDQGSRNIFLSNSPFNGVQKVTSYSGDLGIEIPEVQIGNEYIAFVRGNTPNPRGEIANPAMVTENIDRTVYTYHIATQRIDTLGKGNSIKISHDGKLLAYVATNQIYIKVLGAKSPAKKLTQLRGSTNSLVWSPKNDKIAFVSQRGDHSFIGIIELLTDKIYFINESLDKDRSPVWNAEGTQIAYVRIPNVHQQMLFMPIDESLPWSIWITNLANLKSKKVFTAIEGMGSHLSNSVWTAEQNLIWKEPNQLIFPYEKNGWNQLYALNIENYQLKHITKGEGEVEWMQLSNDGKGIYYVTNIGDIERKHIGWIELNTLSIKKITTEEAIHFNPVETKEGWVFLKSDHAHTPWPVILKNGQTKEIGKELKSKIFPKFLRKPQSIMITATDGKLIPAQIFFPKDYQADKKYPATIFMHGGSRRQMLLGFHIGQYYANSFALNQYMSDQGYIVISLNYRSGIGYGVAFREAADYGPTGASEVRDVIGTGMYLRSRPDVDGSKISLWGGSYGGYLTAHGLAQASDIFSCGVDIHGVHDWNDGITIFNTWYEKTAMPEFALKAWQSSPMNFMKTWKSPVLLIHGDDDRNVAFNQSVRLVEQLRLHNVYHEQLVFPDDIHSFLLHKNWV
ncbi:MAG TPA: prolyl oligopeptidase family serine peptidase, partial [Saprospiraceae bacterium]|nr:prolyl oligopeptidase family serine peptidase [Saprospiraceae bacterium]